VVDLEQFESFLSNYNDLMWDYINFWKWKLKVENKKEHILDDKHIETAFRRLSRILPRWQTYRPFDASKCLQILRKSLQRISDAYDTIRGYSLLEFNEAPNESLELIWHELGRTKERGGRINRTGRYYVVAICKPLMLLWGQTLAYDSLVRQKAPFWMPKDCRWSFEDWKRVTGEIQRYLKQNSQITDFLKKKSKEMYGTDSLVPYGEFLDYYYWCQGKCF